jgi:KTSC domain
MKHTIERIPVNSSSIASIGYNPDEQTMHVEFSSGKIYEYEGVDHDTHSKLLGAASVGAHFGKHIRPHYSGRAIG